MAKTIINLTDPVSTLVTKSNTISSHLGDISQLQVGASFDSDIVQAINRVNSIASSTDSADIITLIKSSFQKDSANGIGFDSADGRFFVPSNTINSAMIENASIISGKLATNSVGTDAIIDVNVTTAKIANLNVTTAKIANLNVTTGKIAADAVDGTKIADDAINSEHYTDGSIDTAHIADDQVTEDKMADDAIGSAQLKSLSTLLIKNYSGSTLKTIHGAGA